MMGGFGDLGRRLLHVILGGFGSIGIAFLAAIARGDLMLILISLFKQFRAIESNEIIRDPIQSHSNEPEDFLSRHKLTNVHWVILASLIFSYVTYFALCGFMYYYFYIRQRHQPEKWKCQPDRWLTKENERHEMILGILNMGLGGTVSGVVATYILNGGYTLLYFDPHERSLFYIPLSLVLVFLLEDGLGYYAHRLYHHPWMYRTFHKWHHRYNCPTPFSSTALHPLEFLTYQSIYILPSLFIPMHAGVFLTVILYNYYYGVWDHSGINMEAVWPWQPHTKFHDDHHRYFHANFGFNTRLWDWLHDTLRRDDRQYGEHIFHGWSKTQKVK